MHSRAATVADDRSSSPFKQTTALVLYNLLLVVASPVILVQKLRRFYKKKRKHEFDLRRWTIAPVGPTVPLAPNPGPRVVLLALAFGELRLVESISDRLKMARPDLNLIWAIRDQATIDLCAKSRPEQPVVIWPFDSLPPASRWIKIVKPDVLIVPEKIWPACLLGMAKLHSAKTAVVNGRTAWRNRWKDRFKSPFRRWIVQNVDLFCFQSETFSNYLAPLMGPANARSVTGNMKLDQVAPPLAPERQTAMESWLSGRGDMPLLAAGSTGPTMDEQFVLEAYKKVREMADCRLLLAPRSMHRVPEVLEIVRDFGFTYSLRSAPSQEPADVYVLDTMGELAHAYKFVEAAWIGGTITSTGHNVIEPVMWGVPVSYGPRRGHFDDLQRLCESFGVGFRCPTINDLVAHWKRVLSDAEFRDSIHAKSERLIEHAAGATDKTVEALLTLIDEPAPAAKP